MSPVTGTPGANTLPSGRGGGAPGGGAPGGQSRSRRPRNGAHRGRSRPKEEGGVRLSAAVQVHRTASHERSPLRGREAAPGALVTGRADAAPPAGEEEFF